MTTQITTKVPAHPCKDADTRFYREALTQKSFNQVVHEMERKTNFYNADIDFQNGVGICHTKYVSYSCTTNECEWGIAKSWLLPCRHIFAVRHALNLPLFDINLCNERWTLKYCEKAKRVLKTVIQKSKPTRLQIKSQKEADTTSKQQISTMLTNLVEVASMHTRLSFENKKQVFLNLKLL